jgi:zinc transport system ATP-binding protein
MPLITCKNLCLSYENNTVLSDLSFTVEPGDYLCIVGENGSGKSTLIKALLSLKGAGRKGEIITGDGFRLSETGYLPQQTEIQRDFPASVREVVLSGCLNSMGWRPFYSKAERQRADINMRRLKIEELRRRSYRSLSGGQQQRVLLARALCATKKLLLLDEPAAGLDPVVTNELYGIIKTINDEGITVIMVSHDIAAAVRYASHILHLHNRPLYFGPVSGYIESEVGKRFLGGSDY